ncbi:PREDICTED: autophagy-related protein 9A-like [Acropora digitifera]|uniref:autophagy-related protein 9A-like n=1 Tax=Acropora digitifera TaxID=70779 RepID=UPI00077ACA5A|nr:PREDICTED: autophagy-related protein 9A-like [Acropora digitifera]
MAGFRTQYTRLNSNSDDPEEDLPPQGFDIGARGFEEIEKGRWNHIENLDEFFIRIYEYHRHNGFVCILLNEIFELIQFVFVVLFTSFLVLCVDYDTLFNFKNPTFSNVVGFHKIQHMEPAIVACLTLAFIFWLIRLARIAIHFFKLLEIRAFYKNALGIPESELNNLQWQDVQKRLIEVQKVHQMCVHKEELTELDIHHRILRWKNYMLAMQNKSVISCSYNFPVVGERAFLTEGMKYNLKLILFWGPGSPFQNNWKLHEEYRNPANRFALSGRLSRRIFWIGVANFILSPFILLWVILYSFFTYAEMVKRHPDSFGARKWSSYGRLFFRHFNELDHELDTRLGKAYEPASKYMNLFVSPFLAIFAKNLAFFAGSLFAVLTIFTLLDRDVLLAEHVLTVIAVLGLIIRTCYIFIPDENTVWDPEQLLLSCISADTIIVIIEWLSEGLTEATQYEQAENGKTELSLVNFSIRNPAWKPSERGAQFISTIMENVIQEGGYLGGRAVTSQEHSLPDYRTGSFQGLPYMNPMSLSDPSLTPLGSTTVTPGQQAQLQEMHMNSSMQYLHELRERQVESISPQATSAMSTSRGTVQQSSTSAATDSEHRDPSGIV